MPSLKYRIRKEIRWEASHVLEGLPPRHPCSRMHGHSYRAFVTFTSTLLDEVGFVVDFNVVKAIRDRLDHQHLNDVLGDVNPTAENIATFIYDAANRILLELDAHDDVTCEGVQVWETETSFAELFLDGGSS